MVVLPPCGDSPEKAGKQSGAWKETRAGNISTDPGTSPPPPCQSEAGVNGVSSPWLLGVHIDPGPQPAGASEGYSGRLLSRGSDWSPVF